MNSEKFNTNKKERSLKENCPDCFKFVESLKKIYITKCNKGLRNLLKNHLHYTNLLHFNFLHFLLKFLSSFQLFSTFFYIYFSNFNRSVSFSPLFSSEIGNFFQFSFFSILDLMLEDFLAKYNILKTERFLCKSLKTSAGLNNTRTKIPCNNSWLYKEFL